MHKRSSSSKILSREDLLDAIEEDRRKGLSHAFTNGCFDLLHVGHVRYLEEARRCADRLIVAINTDEQVARLKGEGRPILPQAERAQILASLACVDYVTIFSHATPHALLQLLKPGILVKGGDYGISGIVGRELVWEYGGEVKALKVSEGISTTEIVERCHRAFA